MGHTPKFLCAASLAAAAAASSAAPVTWVDWLSGTAGANGNATGMLNVDGTTVDVSYREKSRSCRRPAAPTTSSRRRPT